MACSDSKEVASILRSKKIGISEKKRQLNQLLHADKKQEKEFITLMCGGKAKFAVMFPGFDLESAEIKDLTFQSEAMTENEDKLRDALGEDMECIERLKAIYDWAMLAEILKDQPYLSFARVKDYEKHKSDLKRFKEAVKAEIPTKYNECFRNTTVKNNYCAYVGASNGKQTEKKCTREDFYQYVKGLFPVDTDSEDVRYLLSEAENGTLLPLQRTKDNSVIPYQLHLNELQVILHNASSYLPFLDEKDESGFTVREKIERILTFRIPYYVGPLNDAHKQEDGEKGFCWICKRSEEPIRPWNFEQVVDLEASGEKFITRMTNKCTYLPTEDILPKHSLLYSEFTVWNELNNLNINGEKPPVELKQRIFDELFCTTKKVTQKKIRDFLVREGCYAKNDDIDFTGIDGDFKSSLSSLIDFNKILGEKSLHRAMIENIIRYLTLFGDDRKMSENKIKRECGDKLTKEELKAVCNLKYSGWGRLSRAFLEDIKDVDKRTGELLSIIAALRQGNRNLMQLLGYDLNYFSLVKEYNDRQSQEIPEITPEIMDDLYVSPAIKRSLWQTLTVAQEIVKITGHPPKRIFVEMARGEDKEKTRKDSRKRKLQELYKACQGEERDWVNEIGAKEEHDFRQDKLYLYYTQMGRCMYTGECIDLSELSHQSLYDIDHIYPRSKTKDDSLDNRVLVKKGVNLHKSDVYPLPREIQSQQHTFWNTLWAKGFISKEKYHRLTRTTPFSDNELTSFISRQLVETRQSTKAAAALLDKIYGDQTRVVYVKAGNISDFRQKFEMLKCREVNDFHHAKDAYLNIVVGNVYDTRFTQNPYNYIKNAAYREYSLPRMYDFNVRRNEQSAWVTGKNGTIVTVRKTMAKNNVLFTRLATARKGVISDQQILRKGNGQLPIKKGLPIERYGGYNKISGAYFILVEHKKGNKCQRSIESIPVYLAKQIEEDPSDLISYCTDSLHLQEPKILTSKIKFNALFEINGFRMHLSSRTGGSLRFKGANQLKVDQKAEKTVRNISKYVARCITAKRELSITSYDNLSAEENIILYDQLLEKLKNSIYKEKLSAQVNTLTEGREKFIKLAIPTQCKLLLEILHLFQCNIVSANLKALSGGGQCGNIEISQNITNYSGIKIINQSPTGLFEQHMDLLSL